MRIRRILALMISNLRASWLGAALAMVGIVVGTGLLAFFLALGQGLRERVLNRIFPANQLEIEPRAVQLFGIEQRIGQTPLDDARVRQVAALPGVTRAFGKQKSVFPARLWGGKELLGYNLFTEAFFDGMPPDVVHDELVDFEQSSHKQTVDSAAQALRCDVSLDCPPGQQCREGSCEVIVWADRFTEDLEVFLPCSADNECRDGLHCVQDRCQSARAPAAVSQRCQLPNAAGNGRDMDFDKESGILLAPCPTGLCATEAACPAGKYCAADNPDAVQGWCEDPLPAVINPLLLEVFNSDMARSLGAAPLGSLAVLYGVRLHVAFGDSFFTQDSPRGRQQYKQVQIVGFSRKAPELGLALPLGVVRHFNARLKGPETAKTYDAILLETGSNQAVPEVVSSTESLGFSLSRKSRAARTFGTVVLVTSLALVLLALVVLVVAGIQIAQTFAMLIQQRRREIAVLRAIGAARVDVMALVLSEAALIGGAGGLIGCSLAWSTAYVVDSAAGHLLKHIPLLPPEGFFVFSPWLWPLSVAVASLCCILGAFGSARRAARLDPARVLAES